VLIVVAIPEGLQLTIAISLAFSLRKMEADGILLRKIDALEKVAAAEEIICGKTATITTAEMVVKEMFVDGKLIKNSGTDVFRNSGISQDAGRLVKESLINNCSAIIEMGDEIYEPRGDATEVALLNFLHNYVPVS
jgi:Ca2+-transporting ATPase